MDIFFTSFNNTSCKCPPKQSENQWLYAGHLQDVLLNEVKKVPSEGYKITLQA